MVQDSKNRQRTFRVLQINDVMFSPNGHPYLECVTDEGLVPFWGGASNRGNIEKIQTGTMPFTVRCNPWRKSSWEQHVFWIPENSKIEILSDKVTTASDISNVRSSTDLKTEVPISSVLDGYNMPSHLKEAWRKCLLSTGMDPAQCIQAGRVALEETLRWLNQEPVSSDRLESQIEAFSKIKTSRQATITHMHTIRKLGNQASHPEGRELNERDRAAFQETAKAMLGEIARKP